MRRQHLFNHSRELIYTKTSERISGNNSPQRVMPEKPQKKRFKTSDLA
jgi:hypothetical protein